MGGDGTVLVHVASVKVFGASTHQSGPSLLFAQAFIPAVLLCFITAIVV